MISDLCDYETIPPMRAGFFSDSRQNILTDPQEVSRQLVDHATRQCQNGSGDYSVTYPCLANQMGGFHPAGLYSPAVTSCMDPNTLMLDSRCILNSLGSVSTKFPSYDSNQNSQQQQPWYGYSDVSQPGLQSGDLNESQQSKRLRVSRTRTKSPATSRTRTKSPATSRTRTKSPAMRQTRTKSPATRQTRTKSPATRQTRTKSPATRQTRTKSPATSRTRTKSPATSRTDRKANTRKLSISRKKLFPSIRRHARGLAPKKISLFARR